MISTIESKLKQINEAINELKQDNHTKINAKSAINNTIKSYTGLSKTIDNKILALTNNLNSLYGEYKNEVFNMNNEITNKSRLIQITIDEVLSQTPDNIYYTNSQTNLCNALQLWSENFNTKAVAPINAIITDDIGGCYSFCFYTSYFSSFFLLLLSYHHT
ncbi:MAG: hypothetical protein K6D38_10970 [Pseudobutyrivibrio sp.]|nr:hypothetical protein [Pseudobutyrivibrio sp.]